MSSRCPGRRDRRVVGTTSCQRSLHGTDDAGWPARPRRPDGSAARCRQPPRPDSFRAAAAALDVREISAPARLGRHRRRRSRSPRSRAALRRCNPRGCGLLAAVRRAQRAPAAWEGGAAFPHNRCSPCAAISPHGSLRDRRRMAGVAGSAPAARPHAVQPRLCGHLLPPLGR
jgi:hypothetical protein